MSDDLLESISQGGSEEEVTENIRIREIADGLRRCCQLYEAQFRNGQENASLFELEQRSAEIYAKSNNLWIPFVILCHWASPDRVVMKTIFTFQTIQYTKSIIC